MADTPRFIDFNRGLDTNDGLSPGAPWKNLSKITSITAGANDQFMLASDSEFDLTARILLNSGLGWSSTLAKPIKFGVYYPLSASRGRPVIRKRHSIAANEWTYSAPNNAWAYTAANTISAYAYLKVGGDWATRTDNALPLDSYPGRWSNSGATLYVYAPSTTNPTAYYGSVVFGGDSSDAAFVVSSPGSVQSMVFEGWRFEEVGAGIYIFNSTGNRRYRIEDMEAENTGAVFYTLTQTAGEVDLEIARVKARYGGTTFISANTAAGVGIGRWVVRDCDLSDCNYGFPQGAIYSQVRIGAQIFRNTIRRARYGVNGKQSDGAAIYTETQSDNNLIVGNFVEDCYLAFQDNSGRTSNWISNVVKDCYAVCKITDTSDNLSTVFNYVHNTAIGCGTPLTPVAGGMAGVGLWGFETKSPAMTFNIQNNLFTGAGVASGMAAIELPTNATGIIGNNGVYGFGAVAESHDGTASAITATGTVSTNPELDGNYVPLCRDYHEAGAVLGYHDFYGKRFYAAPTLGAVQYQHLKPAYRNLARAA